MSSKDRPVDSFRVVEPRVRQTFQELLDGTREKLSGEIETEFPGHGHAVVAYLLTPLVVDGPIDGIDGVRS